MNSVRPPTDSVLVEVPAWLQNGFHRFLRPYLRRHFDAIGVDRDDRPQESDLAAQPLIIFGNHPSWWDPVIAHFLNRNLFPSRQFRAAIDASALDQYAVFRKLGFFGVRLDDRAGAVQFLKTASAVTRSTQDVLWITPEGRFADARDHSVTLMPGVAHLCNKLDSGHAIAMAMEYVFWNERLPVCLIRFSPPIPIADHRHLDKPQWQSLIQETLRRTQLELSEKSIQRRAELFENLVVGKSGSGLIYDTFRRLKAKLTGSRFQARHEDRQ
jgi:1-acyl-sn-glycerol-3-phosphate acyltransferase